MPRICLASPAQLEAQITPLLARYQQDPDALPLFGVPFAVKDNIDVAGWPTTAACPAFSYTAEEDAFVVARLKAAGAVVIGKTNLDQFATGLVGTRSPYGAVCNTLIRILSVADPVPDRPRYWRVAWWVSHSVLTPPGQVGCRQGLTILSA